MKTFCSLKTYLFLGLALLFICGCDSIQKTILTDVPTAEDSAPLRVTVLYPSDCLGDDSYCDGIQSGAKRAEAELGIQLTEVLGMDSDVSLLEAQLREAAQSSDMVLTAGYQSGEPLARVAPEFPEVNFAIVDVVLEQPNVAAINYKANEGSFLVGAIAALKSESGKIGYIGGADVPLLHGFEAGYVAGVQAIRPEAALSIDYISLNAEGFGQPEKAEELALAQYANGVDVIYAVAGGAGLGIIEAAKQEKKYVIWVDSNGNHLIPGFVLTSMVKQIGDSVFQVLHEATEGNVTMGVRYLGVADGGVDYSVDEHNQPVLSDEILTTVKALKAQIISGEIVVPDSVSLPRSTE